MKQSSNLLLPISIVVAGLFIGIFAAGAIIYTNRAGGGVAAGAVTKPVVEELSFAPLSADDHVRGSIDASVVLIDYSDLECPFCKRHHATLTALSAAYEPTEFAWVYRHFPIPQLHKLAMQESIASECVALQAGEEGFWSFIDTVYEVTSSNDGLDVALMPEYAAEAGVTDTAAFEACVAGEETRARVEAQMSDASSAGGTGTPYGLIVSDKEITNRVRNAVFKEMNELGAPQLATFSEDRTSVGLSGALPQETLEAVIDILIDHNS